MKWFTIRISKQLYGENIEFDFMTTVTVKAKTESDAMKIVRREFNNFYLQVEK